MVSKRWFENHTRSSRKKKPRKCFLVSKEAENHKEILMIIQICSKQHFPHILDGFQERSIRNAEVDIGVVV